MKRNEMLWMCGVGLVSLALAAPQVAVSRYARSAINRVELFGTTGQQVTTVLTVNSPTLLQPVREDFTSTSGVGVVRIGYQLAGAGYPANKLYPSAWVNGDIWLPFAGDWEITVLGEAEDMSSAIAFALPYVALPNPDAEMLEAAREGWGHGRPAYHAETITGVWNQIHKVEQRLIVKQGLTLSARGGDVRFRWGGPPQGNVNSNGKSYDLLKDGETVILGPAPLASLWVRADDPAQQVEVNLISQRMR